MYLRQSNDPKRGKLEEQVKQVQAGDTDKQNELIQKYQPFIAKSVSEVCRRFIDPVKDEEFSVGLSAFNEAMMSYADDKGSSFLSFAKLVIKRKTIDYIRRERIRLPAASLDELFEDDSENPREAEAAQTAFIQETESWYRRAEIEEYDKKLKEYKLSFQELINVAPKHRDARETAIESAKILHTDPDLRDYVIRKKKIPIKQLVDKVSVSKKTLERNRKYILAVFIIFSEDYIYLKDYMKGVS
ncbi:RNA polymerase sigma factor [Terribacillus aidingensis]|uniref:RNA polymerase sigma factor SigI n=1 Tax=Terribacillus aidingensis TaxID=586416 RepID=A0A285NZ39_9BACI|nr:RNA polymerase sigma-I factor [Terribacillus aidingensis]SNZ14478.1 RNA polymerase sigma factor [Terribacillus aidingensis]